MGGLKVCLHHGGRAVLQVSGLKYVGGSTEEYDGVDMDKLSRLDLFQYVWDLGYRKCGSLYHKNGVTSELRALATDGDVMEMYSLKGKTDIIEVYVDKTEEAHPRGTQNPKVKVKIEVIANMSSNTVPTHIQEAFIEEVEALNENVQPDLALDDILSESAEEEHADEEGSESDSDVESVPDSYVGEVDVEPTNYESEGSQCAEELTEVRQNRANQIQQRERSKKKRPQPPVEVILGALGTDRGLEDEVEQVDPREGLLGGDEDHIDSSDVDSFASDTEDEDGPKRRKRKTVHYDPNTEVPMFQLGMVFKSVYQFREALRKYAVHRGAKLRKRPNDFDRVRATCRGLKCGVKCKWAILASLDDVSKNFIVKTYKPTHICDKTNKNRLCDSKFIAEHFKQTLEETPNNRLWRFQEILRERFDLYVGKTVLNRARHLVMKKFMGDYNEEFRRLHDYKDEILRSNPGSTCVIHFDTKGFPPTQIFRGIYICFKAMKEGFKLGCRKLIGMDGCFLKGVCKGQLLAVNAKDGNSQMYPIAWAVIDHETKHTWKWFLELVQADLEIGEGAGFTIVTDMQKGLVPAIQEVFPNVCHRMCARHVLSNWAKQWSGVERRQSFWKVCKSTFEAQLKDNLQELSTLGGNKIVQDLMNYDLQRWCRVYFSMDNKIDVVDNNMSETFNGWILAARHKTIITMLEEIRIKVMNRHIEMRLFCENKWISDISPMAFKCLIKNTNSSMRCRIEWNGDKGFEVVHGEYRHVVDLRNETCTCRSWGLKGIPCAHAIAALHKQNLDPVNYVSEWYRKEKYNLAYSHFIQPVLNMKMWPESTNPPIQPPEIKILPGRPKKNRRKARDELKKVGKLSRKGRVMKCTICKTPGHNRLSCPNKPAAGEGTSASGMQDISGNGMQGSNLANMVPQNFTQTIVYPRRSPIQSPNPQAPAVSGKKPNPQGPVNQNAYKRPRLTGVGVYINHRTGWTCAQNLAGERIVLSTGPRQIKNASEVTGNLGFQPDKLKWKGKQTMTAQQLQQLKLDKATQARTRAANARAFSTQHAYARGSTQSTTSAQQSFSQPRVTKSVAQQAFSQPRVGASSQRTGASNVSQPRVIRSVAQQAFSQPTVGASNVSQPIFTRSVPQQASSQPSAPKTASNATIVRWML